LEDEDFCTGPAAAFLSVILRSGIGLGRIIWFVERGERASIMKLASGWPASRDDIRDVTNGSAEAIELLV
jgi:hypothetical protein